MCPLLVTATLQRSALKTAALELYLSRGLRRVGGLSLRLLVVVVRGLLLQEGDRLLQEALEHLGQDPLIMKRTF